MLDKAFVIENKCNVHGIGLRNIQWIMMQNIFLYEGLFLSIAIEYFPGRQ